MFLLASAACMAQQPAKPSPAEQVAAAHYRNPFVQTCYTTDPAPLNVGDSVLYVFTGHDEAGADFFWMQEWRVYSTRDMVNWQDHGSPLALESFSWADDRAWAAQVVERGGRFYWYVCAHSKLSGGMAIGVAVADRPEGPYRDALGRPLYENGSWDHIDPTVWIDEQTGQAWMYCGNPNTYYVRLGRDMISTKGDIVKLDYHIDHYQEGPWLYERAGHWYLAYASTCCPEGLGYAIADAPTGHWQSKGYIMAPTQRDRGNHPGIIDFKGKSYVFGQSYDLLGGDRHFFQIGAFGHEAYPEVLVLAKGAQLDHLTFIAHSGDGQFVPGGVLLDDELSVLIRLLAIAFAVVVDVDKFQRLACLRVDDDTGDLSHELCSEEGDECREKESFHNTECGVRSLNGCKST